MINIITILEISDTNRMTLGSLTSFKDNNNGRKKAEELFINLISEQGITQYTSEDFISQLPPDKSGGLFKPL